MSTKGRYGLRVMVELASRFGHGPVLVEDIAKNQEISGKYIHVLVAGLKSAGLVCAVRGPNGGYKLTRSPANITALDVSALEGKSAPVQCVADASYCARAAPRYARCVCELRRWMACFQPYPGTTCIRRTPQEAPLTYHI
jgi:Rrf2 family protein